MFFPKLPPVLCCALLCWSGVISARGEELEFNRDIRPILSDKCFQCHGPDENKREAKLRLDVREEALKVIKPGDPGASELMVRVKHRDPEERMPPLKSHKKLSAGQVATLQQWISEGAPYAPHWAFVPVVRPSFPEVKDAQWSKNGIDRFVLARLEREGLAPSPPTDKITWLRRITLDLWGLPPTVEEVDAFVQDESKAAHEKVVDRLLTSTRYAEYMASFWLDAARYADTDGYQNDRYRYQWVWRDWLIRALNSNQPFDQFVIDQLAGDMLPEATLYQQIATGFCRNHRINSEAGSLPAEWHVENVVDRVDTLGTVFLGLTIGCARCHDHKFDPISQREYYQLFAYFNNVPESGLGPNNGNSPPYIEVPKSWPKLSKAENRAIQPGPLEFQRGGFGGGVVRPKPGSPKTVMIMHEMAEPRATYLLERGYYRSPDKSEILSPGVPEVLEQVPGEAPGNRLELARWLVDPKNPLTARVTVNRYWQRFFGTGIVKTSENFGSQGEPPSHPGLLDWLAVEFVEGGWDVKAIHKTIVMSASYGQSSRVTRALLERDPENRLLTRGSRYRLPAFALRDQALYVSGLLVEKIGGPSAKPYMPPKVWRAFSNNTYKRDKGENLYRRSLSTYWRRTIPPPTMANFNAAERDVCLVRKEKTNTPLQALTMMNNVTFVEASRFMAERMTLEGGPETKGKLSHGFRLVIGRRPTSREMSSLVRAFGKFHEHYTAFGASAEELLQVGEKARDASIDPAEHAAMTMVASLILNLDEAMTKE